MIKISEDIQADKDLYKSVMAMIPEISELLSTKNSRIISISKVTEDTLNFEVKKIE